MRRLVGLDVQNYAGWPHAIRHTWSLAVEEQTGCPVLVNTSFNVRGEPIVCTPQDAYRCFPGTDMDALVLGDCVVEKGAGKQTVDAAAREQYLAQFQLD